MNPKPQPARCTVLVFDEEPITLMTLVAILEHAGYRVLPASTAEAARRQLQQEARVDVVVMDDSLREGEAALGPSLKRLDPDLLILLFSSIPPGRQSTAYDAIAAKPEDPRKLLEQVAALARQGRHAA